MRRSLAFLFGAKSPLGRLRRGRRRRESQTTRSFRFEPLEPRIALTAAGLVEVGAQPAGALTGKIVYTSGGHGWQWSDTLNRWATDRGDNNEIVEDFGNQEQMSFYAEYLLSAGATVVPMRPVGHQLNEVVLDNDSTGVTFSGAWSNSSSSRFYDEDYGVGVKDAVPYRYASTSSGSETAIAAYTPNIPEEGFYPVYTWVLGGTDRMSQLYKINHTGGQTQIRVDHRMVGGGWIYLGTYHFDSGSSVGAGSVEISNEGMAGKVVIADAIRFGNGMGDMKDGPAGVGNASGVISGHSREDENSLMWLWRSVGQGVTPSSVIGTSNVSAPTRMAEWMNADANAFGTSVYIGFHSNAGGGRGAVGLINSDVADRTPHQSDLALFTGRQINQDMQALNGVFEYNWSTRTTHTFSGGFGEIDEGPSAEMDATIIEVGFHDSVEDAALMRDPKVRDRLGRSTYEATLEYFDVWGGLTSPVSVASAPINFSAVSNASGAVTLSWSAGPTGVLGAAATGYRIYASTDGYGFDGGTFVAGIATGTATLTGYDQTLPYFFKIVAVNVGGESKASEVMTAIPAGGASQALIVSGFDRFDRFGNVRYPYAFTGDGLVDRVYPRLNNSFDYVVQVAAAINATAPSVHVASASNEAVISGAINLANYDAVIWILGEESVVNDTFNVAEQALVASYLTAGGKLFLSGSEIAWDLDSQNNGRSFFESQLRGNFVSDDANSYAATGAAGSIFAGLALNFDNGQQFYNVDAPDRISPLGSAMTALTYSTGGAAAIQHTDAGTGAQVVMLAFPFETITTAANRAAVMNRVLQYFELVEPPTEIETVLDNDNGPAVYTETGTWSLAGAPGYNGLTYRFATVGTVATAVWQFTAPFAGHAEVFVYYRTGPNRATSASFNIDTGNGIETVTIDQKMNDATFVSLGTFNFTAGVRTITLDALNSAGGSVVIADAVRVKLTTVTEPTADFDGSGAVDGSDFLAWQLGFGAADPGLEQGDANGDGAVDAADLAVWQTQFGRETPAPASIVAMPTMSAAALSPLTAGAFSSGDFASLAQQYAARTGIAAKTNGYANRGIHPSLDAPPSQTAAAWTLTVGSVGLSQRPHSSEAPTVEIGTYLEAADLALISLTEWSWRDQLW